MINLVKIGLWGMFINYYPFHIMTGHFIPRGTYIFFALILIGIVFDGDIYDNSVIKSWFLYAVVSLIAAPFAINTGYATKSLIDFGVKLVVTYGVVHVCLEEKSIAFAWRLLAGIALLSAGSAFIQMGSLDKRLELDSGAAISVNDFGALMAYGCFAVIPLFKYAKIKSSFIKQSFILISSLLLLIELFIAGSRKSFYAVVILYALLLVFVVLKDGLNVNPSVLFSTIVLGIVLYYLYTHYLEQFMFQTSLYERLIGEKESVTANSDDARMRLYSLAWDCFKENPILGIGFNNFKYRFGVYTHSTYADPLACSGFFSMLYLVPIINILYKQVGYAFNKFQKAEVRIKNMELLVFYIVFLFIGFGIPYLYKEIPCIGFGMIIAWQELFEHGIA